MNDQQFRKLKYDDGIVAALDQSGGSTPEALRLYGIPDGAYSSDDEMFRLVHEMRTRIMTSPSFNGDRILGAILFLRTMDSQVGGRSAPDYLWSVKHVVPFLKVDKGLADEADGVRLMKPIPDLEQVLAWALDMGVFGTKMRSVIRLADDAAIASILDQQFQLARRILAGGLVPIIEPEVDITSPQKAEVESLVKAGLTERLGNLRSNEFVMLKLTLPEVDDLYAGLVSHPNVLRVVALSGGYSRKEANARLARNHGIVASFSRAFTEGLSAQQSDAEFDATLDATIASIFEASKSKTPVR